MRRLPLFDLTACRLRARWARIHGMAGCLPQPCSGLYVFHTEALTWIWTQEPRPFMWRMCAYSMRLP